MLPGNAVFGCDDTAKHEFLNKRKAKGEIAAPQSQSNLWFVKPGEPGDLRPATGYDEKIAGAFAQRRKHRDIPA
jgi:hypothetical protein